MQITVVVGNRPQFIKAASIYRALSSATRPNSQKCEIELIHTGQHYDTMMSDVFFQEMELPHPATSLGIGGGSHGAMTGKMLEGIEQCFMRKRPDWVMVFGDTNSTLAAALAAAKLHIPLAHVEAGLRSFNRRMPEETNRVLTDHCSDALFTPTEGATRQLMREGIPQSRIHQAGDVMLDVFLHYKDIANQRSTILDKLGLKEHAYVLSTVHRAENTDDPARLEEIILGLGAISRHAPVIFPVHPRTQKILQQLNLAGIASGKMRMIDPVGYFDMIRLESGASVIMTDSGGVQKEAYFSRVPCLTLREETEWTELVEHGYNRLVPLQRKAILESYTEASNRRPDWSLALYGDGNASAAILEKLQQLQRKTPAR